MKVEALVDGEKRSFTRRTIRRMMLDSGIRLCAKGVLWGNTVRCEDRRLLIGLVEVPEDNILDILTEP